MDVSGNPVAGPVGVAEGLYAVDVPDDRLGEDLIFECTGGFYRDEAGGTIVGNAGALAAFIPGGALVGAAAPAVHIGAGSTVVREMIRAGVAPSMAPSMFEAVFGESVETGTGIANTETPEADAGHEELMAGLRNAAFSQLTADMGLPPEGQTGLLEMIGLDLGDGVLDGLHGGTQLVTGGVGLLEDTQNRYERAIVNFRAGGRDGTGLTAPQIGRFPFGKVAYTDSYRVEYRTGMTSMSGQEEAEMMGAGGGSEGRSTFMISVTDRVSGVPVPGLTLSVTPWMFMEMHSHTTPVGSVVDNGDGTYSCTVYYLMASTMMSGMSMGYWEIRVAADGETAYFHPTVTMAMGDTVKATLKDADDRIPGAMGNPPSVRNYYVFNDGLVADAGQLGLNLYIATRQSMMSHPGVSIGTGLADGNGVPWMVESMVVEVSTDGGGSWVPLVDQGGGRWGITGLGGLTAGPATLEVRLTVNGSRKTTDGTPNGNDAMFGVTVP